MWLIPVGSLQIVIMYECYVHKWCIALPVPLAFAFFSLFTSIGFFSASHVQSILVKGPFDNDYEAEARQQLIRRNLVGGFILLAISVIFMIEVVCLKSKPGSTANNLQLRHVSSMHSSGSMGMMKTFS